MFVQIGGFLVLANLGLSGVSIACTDNGMQQD